MKNCMISSPQSKALGGTQAKRLRVLSAPASHSLELGRCIQALEVVEVAGDYDCSLSPSDQHHGGVDYVAGLRATAQDARRLSERSIQRRYLGMGPIQERAEDDLPGSVSENLSNDASRDHHLDAGSDALPEQGSHSGIGLFECDERPGVED
jgi:hypothetical protein